MRFNPLQTDPPPPETAEPPKRGRRKGIDLSQFEALPDSVLALMLGQPDGGTDYLQTVRQRFRDFCGEHAEFKRWRVAWQAWIAQGSFLPPATPGPNVINVNFVPSQPEPVSIQPPGLQHWRQRLASRQPI